MSTRREDDAVDRLESREHPIRTELGHERVVAVGWANNTFWRLAVTLAFAASLFSIYDNGVRVNRLEHQVCETLYASKDNLDKLTYYREHPDEREDARRDLEDNLARFHCPEPKSPLLEGFGKGLGSMDIGIVEFRRATPADDAR